MPILTDAEIYPAIGEAGFVRLVHAFYRRIVTDDLLGPLYPPDDLPAAEARLRGFLIQRFGGPADYSAARGHPRLRMRHAPFRIDADAATRWLELMDAALAEAALPAPVEAVLRPYFVQTATHMINHL